MRTGLLIPTLLLSASVAFVSAASTANAGGFGGVRFGDWTRGFEFGKTLKDLGIATGAGCIVANLQNDHPCKLPSRTPVEALSPPRTDEDR
jgi:hypothetical protein